MPGPFNYSNGLFSGAFAVKLQIRSEKNINSARTEQTFLLFMSVFNKYAIGRMYNYSLYMFIMCKSLHLCVDACTQY